ALLTSSDTLHVHVGNPSTLIGGRDAKEDQRLRLDELESKVEIKLDGGASQDLESLLAHYK
ncbi:hypothetical protein Tco_0948994, partial [Tanacetum coccineum]